MGSESTEQLRRGGFTLLELIVVVAIVLLLAGLAVVNFQDAQTRAKVSASKSNLRTIANALDLYRLDNSSYPVPRARFPQDPFGIVAKTVLQGLTTPVAYIGPAAFEDPFGLLQIQSFAGSGSGINPASGLGPPVPQFNSEESMLYFHYPYFAWLTGTGAMSVDGYAVVSIGPDQRDSFIVYYPFPVNLPDQAARFGIENVADTIYDPTNGMTSGGDLAVFGGAVPAPGMMGGGGQ